MSKQIIRNLGELHRAGTIKVSLLGCVSEDSTEEILHVFQSCFWDGALSPDFLKPRLQVMSLDCLP
jgi:hypothetical protein